MRWLLALLLVGVCGCYDVRPAPDDPGEAWRINRATGEVCHFDYGAFEPYKDFSVKKVCSSWYDPLLSWYDSLRAKYGGKQQ